MGIRQHISEYLNEYKRKNGLSVSALAAELGISCSTLQTYLNGTGNPRADTIEHMAKSIGVDPAALVCSSPDGATLHFITLMASYTQITSYLPPDKKALFGQLASLMLSLWEDEGISKDLEGHLLDK